MPENPASSRARDSQGYDFVDEVKLPLEARLKLRTREFLDARRRQALALAWGALLAVLWGCSLGVFLTYVLTKPTSSRAALIWMAVEMIPLAGLIFASRVITRAENRSIEAFDYAVWLAKGAEKPS